MKINSMTIEIDNFENAAMVDSQREEVIRILQSIIVGIENYGVPNADGTRLRDSNGNSVGAVTIDFDEEDSDEDYGPSTALDPDRERFAE